MTQTREIAAADAHPLRRQVLRKGFDNLDVHFPEDDAPGAFHLGVFVDDALVGVASFSPNGRAQDVAIEGWQLRGMAVGDGHQGQGLGALLIDAAVERISATGDTVLWCNARDSAQGFYAKLGFVVVGDGFVTQATGLPHHVMVRRL
ncbi:MAG: hypothetical protein QOJ00_2107 [Actinomycetota bacterium]